MEGLTKGFPPLSNCIDHGGNDQPIPVLIMVIESDPSAEECQKWYQRFEYSRLSDPSDSRGNGVIDSCLEAPTRSARKMQGSLYATEDFEM
jgi:hypothetical protein